MSIRRAIQAMGVVLVVAMAWLPASASEGTGAEVLAIGRSDPSGGSEVVIIDRDGSGARTIFHHPGPATFETLAWSPDGRTLAVDMGVATDIVVGAVPPPDADRRHETHLVDVATGASVRLHHDQHFGTDPVWLEDGTLVTLELPPGRERVPRHVRHWTPDGRPATAIPVPDGGLAATVRSSPDGSRFVLTTMPGEFGDLRLHLYDTATMASTHVASGGMSASVWSPTGDRVVLALSEPDHGRRLVIIDAFESIASDLTLRDAIPSCYRSCSELQALGWSADGRRIIGTADDGGGRLLRSIDARARSVDPFAGDEPAVRDLGSIRNGPDRFLDRVPGPLDRAMVLTDGVQALLVADDGLTRTEVSAFIPLGARPLVVTPDGGSVVVTQDGSVRIVDVSDGRVEKELVSAGPETVDLVVFGASLKR